MTEYVHKNYKVCPEMVDEKHVPDWETLALADGGLDIISSDQVLFDVWCSACGLSGTISIDPKTQEIAWG